MAGILERMCTDGVSNMALPPSLLHAAGGLPGARLYRCLPPPGSHTSEPHHHNHRDHASCHQPGPTGLPPPRKVQLEWLVLCNRTSVQNCIQAEHGPALPSWSRTPMPDMKDGA